MQQRRTQTASLLLAAAALLAGAPAPAAAQETEDVEVAPIECWSRTSTNAVRVGEQFTLVITCAVLETTAATVVPDQSTLDPAALQLAPFEVVGGRQADDVRTGSRRLFQYEYTVRFLGEEFGNDVTLPGPTVTYRVERRVQSGASVEGRELEYLLPSHPIRVLSLVPEGRSELREPVPATFAAVQQRRLRSDVLRLGGFALVAVGGVLAVWALAGLIRSPQRRGADAPRLPSTRAVVRRARAELNEVGRARQAEGWTPALAARALTALRILGAAGASQDLAEVPVTGSITPAAGQLLVPSRWPRTSAVLVSGAATAESVARHPDLVELRTALDRFTAAVYGRAPLADADLDEALNGAERAAERVARAHAWSLGRLRWTR